MVKPFDLADLGARLKAKGLPVAEDALEVVAGEFMDWAQESCMLHTNPIVQVGGPVITVLKPLAMGQIDKLDGVTDQ